MKTNRGLKFTVLVVVILFLLFIFNHQNLVDEKTATNWAKVDVLITS